LTPQAKLLVMLIDRHRAGVVTEGAGGRLTLTYDSAWRALKTATRVSLSMPLTQGRYEDPIVRAFLWGLLPDNEQVLERWARTYQAPRLNRARG
jgi:serine/threonine-protein kinase HipA